MGTLVVPSPAASGGAIWDVSLSCAPLLSLQHVGYGQEVLSLPQCWCPEACSHPLGQVVPPTKTQKARRRARRERSCLTSRCFEGHGQNPPLQQGLPPQLSLPPEGTESGPPKRHVSLAPPVCLFSSTGTACSRSQVSGRVSHLGTPARLLSTCVPLEKLVHAALVVFSGLRQHCQEAETPGKASARLRHRGCRRTGRFPLRLCPTWESGHRSGPQLTGGIPLCAALVPWASRDSRQAPGCSSQNVAGATFVQESHLPSSAERGPDAATQSTFSFGC